MLTVGSLFSGIGGLELGVTAALARVGVHSRIAWQAEINPYARAVLAKHWPDTLRFEDVRHVDAGAPPVDLVCGGFPCQDLSIAGKRAGIDGARSGLWSEFARVVRVLRPRYVVVENVPELLAYLGRVLGPAVSGRWWEAEPDVGRVVDGAGTRLDARRRRARLRGLGNGVVPQQAALALVTLAARAGLIGGTA